MNEERKYLTPSREGRKGGNLINFITNTGTFYLDRIMTCLNKKKCWFPAFPLRLCVRQMPLLFFINVTIVWAEEPRPEPQVPFFKFPQGDASWTIEAKPVKSEPTPSPTQKIEEATPSDTQLALKAKLQSVQVVIYRDVRRDVVKWSTGKSTEIWLLKDVFLVEHPSGQWINTYNRRFAPDAVELHLRRDIKGFEWLSLEKFKDIVTYNGKRCFHYKMDTPAPLPKPASNSNNPSYGLLQLGKWTPTSCEAWIDMKTSLPVGLNDGEYVYTYSFGSAPSEPLKLSPKMQAEYDRFLKDNS
jgi:hypothetical protein